MDQLSPNSIILLVLRDTHTHTHTHCPACEPTTETHAVYRWYDAPIATRDPASDRRSQISPALMFSLMTFTHSDSCIALLHTHTHHSSATHTSCRTREENAE